MSSTLYHGHFIWHELHTHDVDGAAAFYARALGWSTAFWPGSSYRIFCSINGVPLAGLIELRTNGQVRPAHWMGCIGSRNTDHTCARATHLGGVVVTPPRDTPLGLMATLADASGGAVFSILTREEDRASPSHEPHGVSWHELVAGHGPAALAFYQALFGWAPVSDPFDPHALLVEPGPGTAYPVGIISAARGEQPRWRHGVATDDIDQTVDQIVRGGGVILDIPLERPDGSIIAHFSAPDGSLCALHGQP